MTYDPEQGEWDRHSEPPADPTPETEVEAMDALTLRLRQLEAYQRAVVSALEPDDDPFSF